MTWVSQKTALRRKVMVTRRVVSRILFESGNLGILVREYITNQKQVYKYKDSRGGVEEYYHESDSTFLKMCRMAQRLVDEGDTWIEWRYYYYPRKRMFTIHHSVPALVEAKQFKIVPIRKSVGHWMVRLDPFGVWYKAGKFYKKADDAAIYRVLDKELPQEIHDEVKKLIPDTESELYELLYPTLKGVYGSIVRGGTRVTAYSVIDSLGRYAKILGQSERLTDGVKKVLGNSGKQAMRLVLDHPERIGFAASLKGIVPWDVVHQIVTMSLKDPHFQVKGGQSTRKLLKLLPSKMILRLRTQPSDPYGRDEIQIPDHRPAPNVWRSFEDCCRSFSVIYRVRGEVRDQAYEFIRTADDWNRLDTGLGRFSRMCVSGASLKTKFKVTPQMLATEALSYEGYTIKYPRTYQDVFDWGEELEHCIFNYAPLHKKGDVVLSALYKDGVLVANAEHDDKGLLKQFHTKFNGAPSDEMCVALYSLVRCGQA